MVLWGQDLLRSLLPAVLRALRALIDADEVRILGQKNPILALPAPPPPSFRGRFG